jgi:hypothetical protein
MILKHFIDIVVFLTFYLGSSYPLSRFKGEKLLLPPWGKVLEFGI